MRSGSGAAMERLISIIVPVYQVQPYLRDCLESIRIQTYKKLEVIVVDDGSVDGSGEICDEYSRLDERFRVIHQNNQGTAKARQRGMCAASGDYIGFVDGDDLIAQDMYRELIKAVEADQSDIAVCLQYVLHSDENCVAEDAVAEAGVYEKHAGVNAVCDYLFWGTDGQKEGISISLVDKLFRRELLSGFLMRTDERLRYCEDSACVVPCLMQAERVTLVNEPYYYYRQRAGSACHSVDTMYLAQFNIFYQSVLERITDKNSALKYRLDKYFVSRIYEGMNQMMGLALKEVLPLYVPPIAKLSVSGRIVIYGAGVVGKDYYRMMRLMCPERIAGWADRRWSGLRKEGLAVLAPESLYTLAYEHIMIAVLFKDSADKIRDSLIRMGISADKIYWEPPGTVLDESR